MIEKILIANRGEIAVRIILACRELGIKSVAVFSEADTNSIHTHLADESVLIGASEPGASYLDITKIIAAAKQTGADAIHPGYGFLSERANFSEECGEANIIFIGPSPAAMRKLGAKIEAKQLAVNLGVPVTPGYFEPGATAEDLQNAAERIGYPVMLKASAGGGGRGMRAVYQREAFLEECAAASDEALRAFGDGAMMVEKLVERPRHIEVQVLADIHGNVACLCERECSIQRRHQKVLEESPSPLMTEDLWAKMQASVRRLVLGAGYTGAGTVEFIVDPITLDYYFLEVNARLQVEHPVTEAVTGVDLVHHQISIANGEELKLSPALMKGDRAAIRGHALECRVVAEDPSRGFLPSSGRIIGWQMPSGLGIRVDTGFGEGREISRFYDSLIAKVIASGEDRIQAIQRMLLALDDTHIIGIRSNIAFLKSILEHESFREGDTDTGFIARLMNEWKPSPEIPPEIFALAASRSGSEPTAIVRHSSESPAWETADGFRIGGRNNALRQIF